MKKILVVDDDPAILDVTKIILETDGYNVETDPSGESVTNLLEEAVQSQLPSLVILDIMLPGKDGRELCKKLKKNPRTKNIPVILFSAHSRGNDQDLEGVAYDYFLPKPFDMYNLTEIVRNLSSD